jgi:ABC-type multidrug transport system fused ATPase/permease subunit
MLDDPVLEGVKVKDVGVVPRPKDVLVQFSSPQYFVLEGEGAVEVVIERVGSLAGRSSCTYRTVESPHESRVFFVPVDGRAEFAPGQRVVTFKVPIIEDSAFGSCIDFAVELSEPQDCELDVFLSSCRVKIIDDDVFPTNRFRELVHGDPTTESWQSGRSPQMFSEYVRFTWANTPRAWRVIAAGQVQNIYEILILVVMKVLVDDYLRKADTLSKADFSRGVAGLAALCAGPFLIIHSLDFAQHGWGVAGGARRVLQENLLRKFLNYDAAMMARMSTAEFQYCVGHDVPHLVADGFGRIFDIYNVAGKILMLVAFQAVMATSEPGSAWYIYLSTVITLAMPVPMGVWWWLRRSGGRVVRAKTETCQRAMLDLVGDAVNSHRLIADFRYRPKIVNEYDVRIHAFNDALAAQNHRLANDRSFPAWLALFIQFAWIISGGDAVYREAAEPGSGIRLGTFLAVLSIYRSVGAEMVKAYHAWLQIQTQFPALWRVVKFMNGTTDLAARLEAFEHRHTRGKTLRDSATEPGTPESGKEVIHQDDLPIELRSVSFKYKLLVTEEVDSPASPGKRSSGLQRQTTVTRDENITVFEDASLTIPQGKLVAVIGRHESGKATLLKLLDQIVVPAKGTVFVPPHLRVLHVSPDCQMRDIPIADNLLFGRPGAERGARFVSKEDQNRAWRICRRLAFPPRLLMLCQDLEADTRPQLSTLSAADRKLLHLARALLADPDVLVVHKPGVYFDTDMQPVIWAALRAFVDDRGVDSTRRTTLGPSLRPRTCIFSTSEHRNLDWVDFVVICESQKMELVQPGDLGEHKLSPSASPLRKDAPDDGWLSELAVAI